MTAQPEFADPTGRFRLTEGPALESEGSIEFGLEEWAGGAAITPETIEQQLVHNNTPAGIVVGPAPAVRVADLTPLGVAYETSVFAMYCYYVELVDDQAVTMLVTAESLADADLIVAWADGRIVRAD